MLRLEALEEDRPDQSDHLLLSVLQAGVDVLVGREVERVVHRQDEERRLLLEGCLQLVEQLQVGHAELVRHDPRYLGLRETHLDSHRRAWRSPRRTCGCSGE